MFAQTTKQMMDGSKLFRLCFYGSIFCISAGIILCIVFPFTSCPTSYNYYSCYNYYSYYVYQCISYQAYCCASGYRTCGDSTYCVPKPKYYRACDPVIFTGSSLIGLGLLLAIFVFVMFRNFKQRVRNGDYSQQIIVPTVFPVYYNNIAAPINNNNQVVYSDSVNSVHLQREPQPN